MSDEEKDKVKEINDMDGLDKEYASDYYAAGAGYPPEGSEEEYEDAYYEGTDEIIEESTSISLRNILMEAVKLDKKTITWWNSRSAEEQKKHVDAHPEALVAKLVKSGQLKYGEKIGGETENKEKQGEEAGSEQQNQEVGKKIARQKLASVPYEKLPETEKEKDRTVAKKILDLYKKKKDTEKEKEENKDVTKIKGTPASDPVIIDGKNKTLRKVKTHTTQVWNRRNTRSVEEIVKNNKNYNGEDISIPGKQFKMPSFVGQSGKFPKKYVKVIETMMNTKTTEESSTKPPITYFTGQKAGKGIVTSQAGEILTMMSVTMNNNDFKDFRNSMLDHIKETRRGKGGKYIIEPDWIKAAELNRKAIFNRISKQYKTLEPSSLIVASCWDSKEEAEALGMTEYDKNKAKSTDIFLKIKHGDNEYLNEISLKKSPKAKLLNARSSRLHEWDKNLPKDADIRVYSSTQKDKLKNIKPEIIKSVLDQYNTQEVADIHKEMKKHNFTIDDVMNASDTDQRRVLKMMHKALASIGNPESDKILKELDDDEQRYQEAVMRELSNNPKVKEGLLEEIVNELPLKNAFNKEVSVAMGDLSVDDEIMKHVFDVKQWKHMKEHVKSFRGKPPYVGYELESTKEILKIANIQLREYGKGFSGEMRFEMTIHPDFLKRLQDANKFIYEENKYISDSRIFQWLDDKDAYILEKFKI